MGKNLNNEPDDNISPPSQNIIAKFGSTIQNVTQIINTQVNEKIIKRLGLEQRIGFALVYGTVIVTSLLLFWALRNTLLPKAPQHMTGEFNIAITEFGQLDENGKAHTSEEGKKLSATLYHRLEKELKDLPIDATIQIWHNELNPRLDLSFIPGRTSEERAESAATLSKEIEADVIVYGNLRDSTSGLYFLPEFYIAELLDAGELIGTHELGSEIAIQGAFGNLGGTVLFNEKLSARTKVLTHFVMGLAWEIIGAPERALEQFYQARDIDEWEDEDGKEIVYLFIGREAGTLWRQGEEQRGEELRTSMETAIALNKEYGRAYLGLGNYHRELAQRLYTQVRTLILDEKKDLNSEAVLHATSQFHQEINQALYYYNMALNNLPTTYNSTIEAKIHLSLGSAHNRQGGLLILLHDYPVAESYLDSAILQNEKALSLIEENDYRHFGLAYLGEAVSYHQKAYINDRLENKESSETSYEKALSFYTACINTADKDEFDWFLQQFKEDQCVPGQQDVEIALEAIRGK